MQGSNRQQDLSTAVVPYRQSQLQNSAINQIVPTTPDQAQSNSVIEAQLAQLSVTQTNILSRIGLLASSPLISRPMNLSLLREVDEKVKEGQMKVDSLRLEEQRMLGVIEGLREKLKEERKKYVNKDQPQIIPQPRSVSIDHQGPQATISKAINEHQVYIVPTPSEFETSKAVHELKNMLNANVQPFNAGQNQASFNQGAMGHVSYQRNSFAAPMNYTQQETLMDTETSRQRTDETASMMMFGQNMASNSITQEVSPIKATTHYQKPSIDDTQQGQLRVTTVVQNIGKPDNVGSFNPGLAYASMLSTPDMIMKDFHPQTDTIESPVVGFDQDFNQARDSVELYSKRAISKLEDNDYLNMQRQFNGALAGVVFNSQLDGRHEEPQLRTNTESEEDLSSQRKLLHQVKAPTYTGVRILDSEMIQQLQSVHLHYDGPINIMPPTPSNNMSEMSDNLGARKVVSRFGTIVPARDNEEISKLKEKVEQLIEENRKLVMMQKGKNGEDSRPSTSVNQGNDSSRQRLYNDGSAFLPGVAGMSLKLVNHPLAQIPELH